MCRGGWEAREAPVGRGEGRLPSFGTCLAPKLSMVGMEAYRDRMMGYYSYLIPGARRDQMGAQVAQVKGHQKSPAFDREGVQ